MNLSQSFLEAIESLAANKMRSALTMLGIIIGVAAVIAMLAIGAGTQDSIVGEIEGIGTNLLFVTANRDENITNPEPLTLKDAEALGDSFQAPSIAAVAAAVNGSAEVTFSGESTNVSVIGITPEYMDVQNKILSEGEPILDSHLTAQSSVAILGVTVAEELFGTTVGLIGETVRISGQPFRVIGLLEASGGSEFGSSDDQVLIPLTTAQVRIHPRITQGQVDIIYASAISAEAVQSASDEIAQILRERHRINLDADDFTIQTQQSFVDMVSTITGVFTIFLGGVAGISLLVGGIGIMNIMLVSVVERTKEIGLRKAMGARKGDILTQFLVESSLLSVVGGGIGIALGWGLSILVGQIAASSDFAINPLISADSVLLATVFSAAVGIFFGLYPANRAAVLEPVEALRSE